MNLFAGPTLGCKDRKFSFRTAFCDAIFGVLAKIRKLMMCVYASGRAPVWQFDPVIYCMGKMLLSLGFACIRFAACHASNYKNGMDKQSFPRLVTSTSPLNNLLNYTVLFLYARS